jgi:hypothetical protein
MLAIVKNYSSGVLYFAYDLHLFVTLISSTIYFVFTIALLRLYLLRNGSGALFNPNSRHRRGTVFFAPEGAVQGIQLTNRPRGGD